MGLFINEMVDAAFQPTEERWNHRAKSGAECLERRSREKII